MVFQVFLNLKDKYFTISSNVYYIKKYFRHNFTVLKTKINNTKFLGHNGFAQSCALFLNMDPGEMWRNVAECGGMWRNVAKGGEMLATFLMPTNATKGASVCLVSPKVSRKK
jgi:hypothetical protein